MLTYEERYAKKENRRKAKKLKNIAKQDKITMDFQDRVTGDTKQVFKLTKSF